jgi:hypothetical protein
MRCSTTAISTRGAAERAADAFAADADAQTRDTASATVDGPTFRTVSYRPADDAVAPSSCVADERTCVRQRRGKKPLQKIEICDASGGGGGCARGHKKRGRTHNRGPEVCAPRRPPTHRYRPTRALRKRAQRPCKIF